VGDGYRTLRRVVSKLMIATSGAKGLNPNRLSDSVRSLASTAILTIRPPACTEAARQVWPEACAGPHERLPFLVGHMQRLRTVATLSTIALFVLLPLYEVVDRGEHWPNDGTYVSLVLFVLFSVGIVLAARVLALIASERSVVSQALDEGPRHGLGRTLWSLTRAALDDASSIRCAHLSLKARFRRSAPLGSAILGAIDSPRFLVLRDFRI